jgi:cytochrome c556
MTVPVMADTAEKRKESFISIDEGVDSLDDLIDQGGQWEEIQIIATELMNTTHNLQSLFPDDSKGQGRARNRVWKQWERFSAKLTEMEQGFSLMVEASKEQNIKKLEEGFDQAESNCNGCHFRYRKLW